MGKILIPGSGGGTDLDVITAGAGDVLAPKVIVDRDGEPVAGTMAEKGAAAYTPGSYNQVIGAGQYLAGEQTILGDGNLASQYIKKGVTIFGVTGTFEGYVPTPTDLYLRGNNIAGFVNAGDARDIIFHSGMIELVSSAFGGGTSVTAYRSLRMGRDYNFAGYSRLNIEFRVINAYEGDGQGNYYFNLALYNGNAQLKYVHAGLFNPDNVHTTNLDISGISITAPFTVKIGGANKFYLYRVWME